MTAHSSQHAYVAWTKQRLDEMDAALASIEAKAGQLKADAKAKASELTAEMKKRRGDFETEVKARLKAGEAAWEASKPKLEEQWANFETELKTYVETVGKDIDQKRTTFADVAAAQAKSWAEAAAKLQSVAAELEVENKAKVDKAIAQVRTDTAEAKARIEKLKHAGDKAWTALSAALRSSRKLFDEASQSAWEALKSAATTTKK